MCSEMYTWRNWKVLLEECWFEACCERSFCSIWARTIRGLDSHGYFCCRGQARNVRGHVLVDPFIRHIMPRLSCLESVPGLSELVQDGHK